MEFYVVIADLLDVNGVDTEAFFEPDNDKCITPLFDSVDDAIAAVKDFCGDTINCVDFFREYANDSEIDNGCSITFRIYHCDITQVETTNNDPWPYALFRIETEDSDINDIACIVYNFSKTIAGNIDSIVC